MKVGKVAEDAAKEVVVDVITDVVKEGIQTAGAVALEVIKEAGEQIVQAVKVRAKSRRMRNPITGQIFYPTGAPVEINDLGDRRNRWTKFQIDAGVLEVVPDAREEQSTEQ